MTDEAVIQEVAEVLAGATRPLTAAEVYAQTELAEGRATVASALNRLVGQDRAHHDTAGNGQRRYAAGPAPDPGGVPEQEAPSGRATGIGARVHQAVVDADGPVTSAQLAEVLGEDVQKVRNALSALGSQGKISAERLAGSNTKAWRPCADETAPDEGWPVRPHRSGGGGPPEPEAPAPASALASIQEGRAREPEAGGAVFAYRSDGAMQIHKGEQAVELSEAETARLMRYLAPWVVERRWEVS
ncbi:hypothetical protein NYO91_07210 [Arhodomonas aquaeolei]|uniref:hypothetical protein n=1 Tax=Arhodomonas aquaeolei TaxID=2369 RepID=UPI0021692BC6|nr:hypothetical protein [Arhodomonas aquaeolei]MCS4503864.1 hypothetical protein [Arhodomonas aquaeolei]